MVQRGRSVDAGQSLGGAAADRVKRRKPLASVGTFVTAIGTAASARRTSWARVLICRVAA
jgi:hypothetical protein